MKETTAEKILNKLQYIVLQLNIHKYKKIETKTSDKMLEVIEECKNLINEKL